MNVAELQSTFIRLIAVMDELREKCPWDQAQTIDSIRPMTIEETYELSEAILSGNLTDVREELGDLLLHIVFYAKIASENGHFNIQDVIENLIQKLIRRHPHIYGETKVDNSDDVRANWEKIKLAERAQSGSAEKKSLLAGIPQSLPALMKAQQIQQRAKTVGFDWEEGDKEGVWIDVIEELMEFQAASVLPNPNFDELEDEFGDLLFSLVNYARFCDIDPEKALELTNRKFIRRFNYIEQQAEKTGKTIFDLHYDHMQDLWSEARMIEKGEIPNPHEA
jgi:MazG family protein